MRRTLNIVTTVLIFVGLALMGIFIFSGSYVRLIEAFRDFGLSIAFYFCEIFGISHDITPTVANPITSAPSTLPSDFNGFKDKTVSYFSLLVNKENFNGWLAHISGSMAVLGKVIAIGIPILVALIFAIRALYRKGNNNYGVDTKPLRIFKFVARYTYQPIKSFVRGYVAFIRHYSWIWKCWIFIFCLHFNLGTIVVEFFAYYFYFATDFDFGTIYPQFVKLFQDVKIAFRHFPIWTLIFVAAYLFDRFRKRLAKSRLRHYEARNCGFINELPIVSMSCGSMGKKKTTLISDMALSQEVMFRQKAFDIIQKCDMRYPYFPWVCFEQELRRCMEYGTVYNLATVKNWVYKKRERFNRHHNADLQLYGYDYVKYGANFNDALSITNLFDTLETYALGYFVYVIECSLIVSNYAVRTDEQLLDEGNFPMWYSDFFPECTEQESRYAHILDFDVLRLGKKVIENNPNAGSFEFGVVLISEVGKERGNNLELKEVKKGTDETNQKNDLFNAWLKMCRHSATIDNFPFIKVFTDEQRPESWGADARDLCDIVHIISSGEQRLTLPFYTIEEMISEWAFNRFISLYYDFRFRRGDNTLLVHILKSVTAALWRRNLRIYNRYGYSVLKIHKERGTMDGKPEKKKYFLMNKKIYSRRFSTDCFSDYFNDLASKSSVGLSAYLEYACEKATVEELKLQNSYFINSLYKTC